MKTKILLTLAVGFASFATNVKGAQTWVYDNLNSTFYHEQGDRITSPYRGLGQSFTASSSASISTLAMGLFKLSLLTGSVDASLYNITGSSSFGSQVGSTFSFNTSSIQNGYNGFDVSELGWNLTAGQNYAVTLAGGSDFYSEGGSAYGLNLISGTGSANNLVRLNNWYTPEASWENVTAYGWDPAGKGLSIALSPLSVSELSAVPEASTSLGLLALGAGGLLTRRRTSRKA